MLASYDGVTLLRGQAELLGSGRVRVGDAEVLAVRFGLRAQDVVSTLHPYLTWAEGIKLAGQTFTKDVAKLSCCA